MENINYQYSYFKSTVPERIVYVGGKHSDARWRFYDYGPRDTTPLVCVGGVAATADAFYKQILALGGKGYRVLSIDFPPVWTHQKWITSLDQFLDGLNIHEIHLYGSSLGGFLAQLYAQQRPRRVLSLILSNTFLDTHSFHVTFHPWCTVFRWTPDMILKKLILSGIQEGPQEPLMADAVDFIVVRVENLSQPELASRLVLNTQEGAVRSLSLEHSKVTLLDCLDHPAAHSELREAVYTRYPKARKAFLKSGGDFPFLSRADEVDLHLLLHLRSVGAERIEETESPVSVSYGAFWKNEFSPRRPSFFTAVRSREMVEDEEERNESDGVAEAPVNAISAEVSAETPWTEDSHPQEYSEKHSRASALHFWEAMEKKQKSVAVKHLNFSHAESSQCVTSDSGDKDCSEDSHAIDDPVSWKIPTGQKTSYWSNKEVQKWDYDAHFTSNERTPKLHEMTFEERNREVDSNASSLKEDPKSVCFSEQYKLFSQEVVNVEEEDGTENMDTISHRENFPIAREWLAHVEGEDICVTKKENKQKLGS